jgi:O-antigen ligase
MVLYNKIEILVSQLLFAMLCCGALFVNSNNYTDNYIMPKLLVSILLASIIIIVFSFQMLSHRSLKKIWNPRYLVYTILITCIGEAIYGLLQYTHLIIGNNIYKGVTGSFDNSAGFASCLCLGLPFVFSLDKFASKRNIYLIILVLCIAIVAIILSKSRSGLVTIFSALCIVVLYKIHIPVLLKISLIILPFIILIGSYSIKKDSAKGRLLIWQCSVEMIKEKPLLGYGIHGFKSKYMNFQADYFKKNPNSKYSMLADNVSHPFNEYLYVLVNYGALGLLSIIFIMIGLYVCYVNNPTALNFSCIISLLSILIFSLFSYPFRYPFTWIILVLDAIFLLNKPLASINKQLMDCVAWGLLIICPICIFYISQRSNAEKRWNILEQRSETSRDIDIIKGYNKLIPVLGNDPYFLYNYAVVLNDYKMYVESNQIMQRCSNFLNDYDCQLLIADNYYQMRNKKLAEIYYQQAAYMCPNRFMPLYYLFKIEVIDNRTKACHLAMIIKNKKVKIPSWTIDDIKQEAILYLQKQKSNI